MIKVDCKQGTPEWIEARLGVPTASQFHRIITPKTLKASSQAYGYMCELIAERLLKAPLDDGTSEWMQRGQALEEAARRYYQFERDCDVEVVGFCTIDDGHVGCSPDGLIGTEGGVEIKCPNAAKQVSHLLQDFTAEYKAQVQGNIWVCERDWWDELSFNPVLPSRIIRVKRDDKFLAAFEPIMAEFLDNLEAAYQQVLKEVGDIDSLVDTTAKVMEFNARHTAS